jgi:hypothetical protein
MLQVKREKGAPTTIGFEKHLKTVAPIGWKAVCWNLRCGPGNGLSLRTSPSV